MLVSSLAPLSISVVVPVHNRLGPLRRALEAVRDQTVAPAEIIVVDDASETPITLAQLANATSGLSVKLHRLEENCGAAHARNAGVNISSGSIIAFLDSDDLWLPTYIEEVALHFSACQKQPSAAVTGSFWCNDEHKPYKRQLANGPVTYARLVSQGNFLGGCSMITVTRAAFLAIGGFRPTRGSDDWSLLLDIASGGRVDVIPRPLVLYRSPSAASTVTMTAQYRRQIVAVRKLFQARELLYDPVARRTRLLSTMLHLSRGGRWGLWLRCVRLIHRLDIGAGRVIARSVVNLLLRPAGRVALERQVVNLRVWLCAHRKSRRQLARV